MGWKNKPGTMKLTGEVDFTSSGYYDPGSTYGPPESCSAPEGECEATLEQITLCGKELPKELAEALFEFLREPIEEQANQCAIDDESSDDYYLDDL